MEFTFLALMSILGDYELQEAHYKFPRHCHSYSTGCSLAVEKLFSIFSGDCRLPVTCGSEQVTSSYTGADICVRRHKLVLYDTYLLKPKRPTNSAPSFVLVDDGIRYYIYNYEAPNYCQHSGLALTDVNKEKHCLGASSKIMLYDTVPKVVFEFLDFNIPFMVSSLPLPHRPATRVNGCTMNDVIFEPSSHSYTKVTFLLHGYTSNVDFNCDLDRCVITAHSLYHSVIDTSTYDNPFSIRFSTIIPTVNNGEYVYPRYIDYSEAPSHVHTSFPCYVYAASTTQLSYHYNASLFIHDTFENYDSDPLCSVPVHDESWLASETAVLLRGIERIFHAVFTFLIAFLKDLFIAFFPSFTATLLNLFDFLVSVFYYICDVSIDYVSTHADFLGILYIAVWIFAYYCLRDFLLTFVSFILIYFSVSTFLGVPRLTERLV